MELVSGIYTDTAGNSIEIPLALDNHGNLLVATTPATTPGVSSNPVLALPSVVNGTIAAGGVSQLVFPANPSRQYIEFSVCSQPIWINFGSLAGVDLGILIDTSTGGWFSPEELPVSMDVNIYCAVAGVKFTAITWKLP